MNIPFTLVLSISMVTKRKKIVKEFFYSIPKDRGCEINSWANSG